MTLKPAAVTDTRSWFALKMGQVTVTGGLDPTLSSSVGLSISATIDALDYNNASATAPTAAPKRLDWAHAFDLDGDGQYDDALNPGAVLPVAADLTIDFAASMQVRLTGTLTGTGGAVGAKEILHVGPVVVAGSAGFGLTIGAVFGRIAGREASRHALG